SWPWNIVVTILVLVAIVAVIVPVVVIASFVVVSRARNLALAFFRLHNAFTKITWLRAGRDVRASMVDRGTLITIVARFLHVALLRRYRSDVTLAGNIFLLAGRTDVDSAIAAVVADAIDDSLVNDGRVIHILHDGDVHVVDGTVVVEMTAIPTAAFVAVAEVA